MNGGESILKCAQWLSENSLVVGRIDGKMFIFDDECCREIPAHTSSIVCVRYSDRNKEIFTADRFFIRAWKPTGVLKFECSFSTHSPIISFYLSPDEKYILVLHSNAATLWSNDGELLCSKGFTSNVISAAWLDKNNLAIAFEIGEIHVLDTTLSNLYMLEGRNSNLQTFSISRERKYLSASWENGDMAVWELYDHPIPFAEYHVSEPISVSSVNDAGTVIIGTNRGNVFLVRNNRSPQRITKHSMMVTSIALSTDKIATASSSGEVEINERTIRLPETILELEWNPDSTRLACISMTREVYIIDESHVINLRQGEIIKQIGE